MQTNDCTAQNMIVIDLIRLTNHVLMRSFDVCPQLRFVRQHIPGHEDREEGPVYSHIRREWSR